MYSRWKFSAMLFKYARTMMVTKCPLGEHLAQTPSSCLFSFVPFSRISVLRVVANPSLHFPTPVLFCSCTFSPSFHIYQMLILFLIPISILPSPAITC